MNRILKLLVMVWSGLMMIATLFLMREYWYLVEQSHKLASLKSEYENQLMAVSRVIYEYNALRERHADLESMSTDGKKKTAHSMKKEETAFLKEHILSQVAM